MKETLRHKEAFEYYYSLGTERSFKLVESKFKVSNMSVARWSKEFNWQERIGQRDIENGVTKYSEKSNLGKFKAKYGKLPTAGDQIKAMTNKDGFLRLILK